MDGHFSTNPDTVGMPEAGSRRFSSEAQKNEVLAGRAEKGGQTISRREALRRTALLLGGALAAPTMAGVLGGCQASTNGNWAPETLTADQNELVTVISEHIIPETDTPGAKAAGVNRFIDKMLGDWFYEDERKRFLTGLAGIDEQANTQYGQAFLGCTAEEQMTLLEAMDKAAYAPDGDGSAPPFFRQMKELTLVGYYTSEVGATQELRWEAVPGRYDGCVPFSEVGRTWA